MKDLPTSEVAKLVDDKITDEGLTLKSCCDNFNAKYREEIDSGKMTKLNKDFVARVRKGEFKIVKDRVLEFCEFLGIRDNTCKEDIYRMSLKSFLSELQKMVSYAEENDNFKNEFPNVTKFARSIKNTNGRSN